MKTNTSEREALRFMQGTTPFYVTVWTGQEIRTQAKAPWYNPETDTGYQRKPKRSRIVRAAKYLAKKGTFPTSVLVNCRSPIRFQVLEDFGIFQFGKIRIPDNAKLNMVDGQTRQLAIDYGAEKLGIEDLNGFGIPVILANWPDEHTEMIQFRTINREQKSVPTDLTDRLLSKELHMSSSQEELIRSGKMGMLRDWKANQVARLLNERIDSPWRELIRPPNAPESVADKSLVSERSMSQSLKEVVRRMETFSPEEIASVATNYWRAVMNRCSEAASKPEEYPYLWKTMGIYTMHMLFSAVYERTFGDTSVENFENILSRISQLNSEFWEKDGELKGIGGIGGFKKIALGLMADLLTAQEPTTP